LHFIVAACPRLSRQSSLFYRRAGECVHDALKARHRSFAALLIMTLTQPATAQVTSRQDTRS